MLNFLAQIFGMVKIFFGIVEKRTPDATVNEIDQTAETIASTGAQAAANSNATKIALAQAQGNPVQRDWFPVLMYLLIAIVANNTFGVAYLHAVEIKMTPQMWSLLAGGTGVVGLFGHIERVTKVIKG